MAADLEFSHAKPVHASWDVDGVAGQFLNFTASQVLKDYNARGWDFVRADGGELYFSKVLPPVPEVPIEAEVVAEPKQESSVE